jgi:hypothetical protein
MNLILSDVEETVMIVDTEANQTINVGISKLATVQYTYEPLVGETEMGDAFRKRRWRYTCKFRFGNLQMQFVNDCQVSPPSRS